MKFSRATFIAVMLLCIPVHAFSAGPGWMRISLAEGDVQIKTPDTGDWGLVQVNVPLNEGDQIWVPEGGRVEMQLNAGSYIRLDQNSSLQVLSLDKDASQFYLSQGHAYVYSRAPRGSVIQVDTPDASTRAFDRAIFRIDMSDQYQQTDVAVYKGYVEAENQLGSTGINEGDMLSLGQNTNGEVAVMGPPDEWEAWNKTRNDTVMAGRGTSARYLPAELSAYSYDFDTYGRWINIPSYGRCWTPTGVVGESWAPYRFGRWAWIDGEYVWVSSDPWGWAPYHYGRWALIENSVWCWVPPVSGAVYWSPGYVGWVRTADYVAWVPLAPGEIYYGRGYYGPDSVNIAAIDINKVIVPGVYKNAYFNNSVTVVDRKTFNTATPRMINVNQKIIQQQIFTKNNISVGTPEIKPARGSSLISSRPVPSAKLPPQSVRSLQVQQLKQAHPLSKDPAKSVLNPGAGPKTMPVNRVAETRTPGKVHPPIQPAQKAVPGKQGVPVPQGNLKPVEKKPAPAPGGIPAPQGNLKPAEKKLVPAPVGMPAPQGNLKPAEKKPVPAPGGMPAPQGNLKPAEKKPAPGGAPAPQGNLKPAQKKPAESEQKDQKKKAEEPK
ncbi:MAG TPA: DUF6600 domain-containing protein [Dissulfurispiraceae bacterium]|nr:DUF6600 domain-containing protein [Dissulfurispiraceae bacterium]